ncbi:MAG: hypothetical protein J6T12_04525 [Salinivirgaceae bacterium]|nr:hypothetical protein [Salinivirgaceae bacterium]
MDKPKTKSQLICEYKAAHPEVSVKELQTVFGTSRQMVMYAIDPETRRKQSERDKANYQRNKKAYYEKKRKYQIARREHIKELRRKYYAAAHPNMKRRVEPRRVELHPWAKPVTLAAVEPVETPQKVRPIPADAKRFVRRQDALLKQMEYCTDSREVQRLMSEYSALQYRIECKQTMANNADRRDASALTALSRNPMSARVANGAGFTHH